MRVTSPTSPCTVNGEDFLTGSAAHTRDGLRRLLRHAVGMSVEDRVYLGSLSYSVKELSEALEAVKFPLAI